MFYNSNGVQLDTCKVKKPQTVTFFNKERVNSTIPGNVNVEWSVGAVALNFTVNIRWGARKLKSSYSTT
jgi:hypothetical protein